MIRSFLPIGQGGFAVEQFDEGRYNVVFDCGTTTRIGKKNCKKVIEDEIRRTFKLHTRIQKVFISHFHEDHINGLPFLLDHCFVDEIYLPYLTRSEQVIALILLHEYMNGAAGQLLRDIITGRPLEKDTRTFYVTPQQIESNIEVEGRNSNLIPSGIEQIISGKAPDYDQWYFIPFAFQGELRSAQFERILYDNRINDTLQREILTSDFWSNSKMRNIVKEAYNTITSNDINLSTMTVFSGSRSKSTLQYYPADVCYCCPPYDCCRQYYPSGCLYTGDYHAASEREWDALRQAYDADWNRIGVFTIPHHGSSNSYNNELARQRAAFIINAGYNNSYRHPNHIVLRRLIENRCRFFWVNEHIGSEVIFRVE